MAYARRGWVLLLSVASLVAFTTPVSLAQEPPPSASDQGSGKPVPSAKPPPPPWMAKPGPTREQREAATRDFRTCREVEAEGDATACWRVWLKRHRETGTEAEVLVAEEHSVRRGPRVPVTGQPPPTPSGRTPATPRSGAADDAEGEDIVLEDDTTDDEPPEQDGPDEAPAEKPPPKPPAPLAPPPVVSGPFFDLCALTPRVDEQRFTKKRAVMLGISNVEKIDSDPKLRALDGARQFRDVFTARMPLPRFHNVVSTLPAPATWSNRESLPVATVVAHFQKLAISLTDDASKTAAGALATGAAGTAARTEPTPGPNSDAGDVGEGLEDGTHADTATDDFGSPEGGDDADGVAAGGARSDADSTSAPSPSVEAAEARFLAYSVQCTDFLVIPTVETVEPEWKAQEVTVNGQKQTVQTLTLNVEATLAVFQRRGQHFERIGSIERKVPSRLDLATDVAAQTASGVTSSIPGSSMLGTAQAVLELPSHISSVPDAACLAAAVATDGSAGLSACGTNGTGRLELALSDVDERFSPICTKASSGKGSAEEVAAAMTQCEVRVRASQLSRTMQTASRKLPGWRLYAPLQKATGPYAGRPGLSLGRDEGMKIGWGFEVRDANGRRIAYYKVVRRGPGGEQGLEEPSVLRDRIGKAPEGARVEEYPQLGLTVQPSFFVGALTQNWGATYVVLDDVHFARYRVAPVALLGGVDVGWDLAQSLRVPELNLRVGFGYGGGSNGINTRTTLMPIDVVLEKGFVVARRTSLYTGIGWTLTNVTTKVGWATTGPAGELKGSTWGATGRLGFDILLTPTVSLRFEGRARWNFRPVDYEKGKDKELPSPEFAYREDHYSMIGGVWALNFML